MIAAHLSTELNECEGIFSVIDDERVCDARGDKTTVASTRPAPSGVHNPGVFYGADMATRHGSEGDAGDNVVFKSLAIDTDDLEDPDELLASFARGDAARRASSVSSFQVRCRARFGMWFKLMVSVLQATNDENDSGIENCRVLPRRVRRRRSAFQIEPVGTAISPRRC